MIIRTTTGEFIMRTSPFSFASWPIYFCVNVAQVIDPLAFKHHYHVLWISMAHTMRMQEPDNTLALKSASARRVTVVYDLDRLETLYLTSNCFWIAVYWHVTSATITATQRKDWTLFFMLNIFIRKFNRSFIHFVIEIYQRSKI